MSRAVVNPRCLGWGVGLVLIFAVVGCGDDAGGRDPVIVDPIPSEVPCPDVGLDPTAGDIHYVCDCGTGAGPECVPGDDAADGATPETAWQTYEQARASFGHLRAGDSIVFCRGGAFTTDSGPRWYNYECRADTPCVIRDYVPDWATEESPAPLIWAADDAFRFEDGGNSDHDEGYVVMNLSLVSTIYGEGQGVFFYNDVDDVLLCNLDIDGFSLGVHVAGSNDPEDGSDAKNARIVLRNSRVTNCGGQGWLGGCDDCGVEYTYFENNGYEREVFNHNIYFSSHDEPTQSMFAIGNVLYRSAIVGGECRGVSFVIHGQHEDMLIAGNTVQEDVGAAGQGCWGIALDTGYDEEELFRNVVLTGNTVINVGNMSLGINACENCVIENNVIIHEQPFGTIGIAAPDRERGDNDLAMTGVIIRNNSLFFGPDSDAVGIRLGGEGTDHVVVSNAIHFSGAGGSFNCFDFDLETSAYRLIDNNLCYRPSAPDAEWVDGQGDLASWQSSSGHDTASLEADPLYTSTTDPHDLTPQSSSPLQDAGHPSESATLDKNNDPRDTSPDIGAYEL